MENRKPSSPHRLLRLQAGLLAVAMAVILLLPPVRGAILLVPLTPAAAAAVFDIFSAGDVRLIGRGTLPGSLIVVANRRTVLDGLLGTPTLIFAAPRPTCGNAIIRNPLDV